MLLNAYLTNYVEAIWLNVELKIKFGNSTYNVWFKNQHFLLGFKNGSNVVDNINAYDHCNSDILLKKYFNATFNVITFKKV